MQSVHLQEALDCCLLARLSRTGTLCQFRCGALELYWGHPRLIWETDKLIALQLTLVPMLNLTAVAFSSVLGIAGKPVYNAACVIIVYELSASVRVTKEWQSKKIMTSVKQ